MGRSRYHTKLLTLRASRPPFADEPGLTCKAPDVDPDLWHSPYGGTNEAAQALCRLCPRLDDCATWAIETRQQWGVWGATTARERNRRNP